MTFDQIYHTYKKLVYNLALQYTSHVQDAEEITQDVFLRVHDYIGDFRQEANLKTWIYRITVNQSLDFIKSKQRKKRSIFSNLFSINHDNTTFEISDFQHPGIALEDREALQQLMSKIYSLPENQKTVVILLKIENLNQKEVAEILQLSEGAVESLFQRAKSNLKKII